MTTTVTDPTPTRTAAGVATVDAFRPGGGPHRRLARFLAGPPAAAYEPVAREHRGWTVTALVVDGVACGAGIGFLLGGAVGGGGMALGMLVEGAEAAAVVVLGWLGLLYGSAIGVVVGAVVGLPAAVVLAAVLAVAPADRPAAVHRRTATTLALLVEALVVFVGAWTLTSDTGEDLRNRVLVVFPAIAVGAFVTARLLRRSTRFLADRWNEGTGWKAVRP